jgi:CBS domain-containing protein
MQLTNQLVGFPTLDRFIVSSLQTVAYDTCVIDAITLLSEIEDRDSPCLLIVEDSQLVGVFAERDAVRLTASGMNLSRSKVGEVIQGQVITLRRYR